MHRDISADVEAFAESTLSDQQRALDRWRQRFNHVRPHEALAGKTPSELYKPRPCRALQSLMHIYPPGLLRRRVHGQTGVVSVDGEKYAIGAALTGYDIGLEYVDEMHYRAWFRNVDLGLIDVIPSDEIFRVAANRLGDEDEAHV
jgi:hypothetical protein